MLTENINVLRKVDREYLKELQNTNTPDPLFTSEYAKNRQKTLFTYHGDRKIHLHSKFDPKSEAERIILQYEEDIDNYTNVLFLGLGLGYHVELFINKYPNINFSFFDPSIEIVGYFLDEFNLEKYPINRFKGFIHGQKDEQLKHSLRKFVNSINGKILLITLPIYEQLFKEECTQFKKMFMDILKNNISSLVTNISYEKRWTFNSLMNLSTIRETPNILQDINKEYFKSKPAILVSAGPSLEDEIENLKIIKEKKLAYIFSVGSAITPLLNHGIVPDAACTYDPQKSNQRVFSKIVDENILTVPLIFGSSVGYETVERYPGPKFHMITSQDTVTPYYCKFKKEGKVRIVNDAPSIAVITLQMLLFLECDPIIIVGQNLAFRGEKSYVIGSKFDEKLTVVNKSQLEDALEVEDVYGNYVKTNEVFKSMKDQLELYTKNAEKSSIFNTTKGGAKIEGTVFIELSKILEEDLGEQVVNNDWKLSKSSNYDEEFIYRRTLKMKRLITEFEKRIELMETFIFEMEKSVEEGNVNALLRMYPRFDKNFKKIQNSIFFHVYLSPMNRVQYESMRNKFVTIIRLEQDLITKTKIMLETVNQFIMVIKRDMNLIVPEINKFHKKILLHR